MFKLKKKKKAHTTKNDYIYRHTKKIVNSHAEKNEIKNYDN